MKNIKKTFGSKRKTYKNNKIKRTTGFKKTVKKTKKTRNTKKMYGGDEKWIYLNELQKNKIKQLVNFTFTELLDLGHDEINIEEGNNNLNIFLKNTTRRYVTDSISQNEESVRQQLFIDTVDKIRRDFRGIDDEGNQISDSNKKLNNIIPIVGRQIAEAVIFEQIHPNVSYLI